MKTLLGVIALSLMSPVLTFASVSSGDSLKLDASCKIMCYSAQSYGKKFYYDKRTQYVSYIDMSLEEIEKSLNAIDCGQSYVGGDLEQENQCQYFKH